MFLKYFFGFSIAILGVNACLYAEVPPFEMITGANKAESDEDVRIGKAFDPASVQTFSGIIEDIGLSVTGNNISNTLKLVLLQNGQEITVQLGPEWVIQSQGVSLKKGDKISILGSKVNIAGESLVIASKVKKGDDVLELRSELGVPIWQDKNWIPSKDSNSFSMNE